MSTNDTSRRWPRAVLRLVATALVAAGLGGGALLPSPAHAHEAPGDLARTTETAPMVGIQTKLLVCLYFASLDGMYPDSINKATFGKCMAG